MGNGMKIRLKYAGTALFTGILLIACGEQAGFVSERMTLERNSGSELATQPQEEDTDDPEEISAELPVIISGSFLACYVRGDGQISCQFSEKDDNLIALLSTVKVLEIIIEGHGPVTLNAEDINRDNNTIVFTLAVNDLQTLKNQKDGDESIVFQARAKEQKETSDKEETVSEKENSAEKEQEASRNEPTNEGDKEEEEAETSPPEPVLSTLNLIGNGSFEADVIPDESIKKDGFESGLTNWERTLGVTSEIQRNVYGWKAQDGSQWTELCSTGDSGLKQVIQTVPGQKYQLKFYFSPQPAVAEEYNHLHVKIAGTEVFHESSDGTALTEPDWKGHERDFTASAVTTEIEFFSSGCTDNLGAPVSNMGTYVDQVTVYEYVLP